LNPDSAVLDLLGASCGLLGYGVIQYFDFPRERIEFQVVLAIFFALIVHQTRFLGTFRAQKLDYFVKFVLFAGLIFNLILGWERMRGEQLNARMMEAQNRGDWRKVAQTAALAENRFYEYTDAAMPLCWHEGVAWFQLGQFEKAVATFERAYQLNPWSFQVIHNYASTLVQLKRYSEAIPLFEKALSINPRYDEGKFNLSYVHFQLNDLARAEAWLSRVDTIRNPGNDADREKNRITLKRLQDFRKVLDGTKK
jgi:tetratricopeptide (TPR) repeat protein